MGFYSGRDGELHVAGTKAAKVQSWSFSSSMAVLETTSLGDTDRTLESGVRSYSGSARLFYYVETPGSGANSNLNALLTAAIKTGDTAGDGGWLGSPSPGSHNEEVYHDVLGISKEDLKELEEDGII